MNGETTRYEAAGVTNPVVLSADNNWYYGWEGLPKEIDGQAVTYTVAEGPIEGWEAAYTYPEGGNEAAGAAGGHVTITNTRDSSYVLPETGGIGPTIFITAGLFFIIESGAGYIYLRHRRRRGEASSP